MCSPYRELPYDGRIEQVFSPYFLEVSSSLGRYGTTKSDVESIIQMADLTPGSNVLDVACGAGRHATVFHELGFSVCAIDASTEQLQIAEKSNPGPVYMQMDAGALGSLDRRFDIALNLYSSFGYCKSVDDDFRWLINILGCLRSGGHLVMELSDLERAIFNLSSETLPLTRGDKERIDFDYSTQTLFVDYLHHGEVASTVNMRIYSKEQLKNMLLDAGFANISLYGSFSREPKTKSRRLVVHARKA